MPDCFIIMPITTPESLVPLYSGDKLHFHHVLEHLFIPALEKNKFNPIRPIAEGSDVIHAEIIKNLEKADLVLCDASCLNPNVFYELGIRTALDKPVCIVKDEVTQKIPFDTTIINHHTYESALQPWTLQKQIDDLATHIKKSVERSGGKNTLWKYFGLSTRAMLPQGSESKDDKLELLALQIEGLIRKMDEGKTVSELFEFPRSIANSDLAKVIADQGRRKGFEIISIEEIANRELVITIKSAKPGYAVAFLKSYCIVSGYKVTVIVKE
ncbi:MAG: hypothetical protein ABSG87_10705 [Verrucomicrobiota bacterium]